MSQTNIMYIIFVINNLVGLFIAVRFFDNIFSKKTLEHSKKIKVNLGITSFAILLNIVTVNLNLSIVFAFLLYFTIAKVFYVGKNHIKVIASFFIILFSMITELMTILLLASVFGTDIEHLREQLLYLFSGGSISKLILLLLVEVFVRYKTRNASKVSLGSWVLIISIPLVSIYLLIISVYNPIISNEFNTVSVITCISILYINLIAFILFENIVSQVDKNNQYRLREEQFLMQETQYQVVLSGYEQVRKVKHDMLNHMISLNGYLDSFKYTEAKKYLMKINNELELSGKGIITNNVVVDALINNRIQKANKSNIDLHYDILMPENLNIDDIDMCIILGNALDNAIEGCERITDNTKHKFINLTIRHKEDNLLIDMKNTYNTNKIIRTSGEYISSKRLMRKNNRGTGLMNIQEVSEKYDGVFDIDLADELFCLRIMLSDKK